MRTRYYYCVIRSHADQQRLTPPMLTLKRHFESFDLAHHARCGAMEIAITGMQRWGKSPVDSGVLPTR